MNWLFQFAKWWHECLVLELLQKFGFTRCRILIGLLCYAVQYLNRILSKGVRGVKINVLITTTPPSIIGHTYMTKSVISKWMPSTVYFLPSPMLSLPIKWVDVYSVDLVVAPFANFSYSNLFKRLSSGHETFLKRSLKRIGGSNWSNPLPLVRQTTNSTVAPKIPSHVRLIHLLRKILKV